MYYFIFYFQEDCQAMTFFTDLICRHFLNNKHCLTLVQTPDVSEYMLCKHF